MASSKIEILKTKVHHNTDGNYHDCDVSLFVSEKLSDGFVSILPIGADLSIKCAYKMSQKQSMRLAVKLLELNFPGGIAKETLEKLDNAINLNVA